MKKLSLLSFLLVAIMFGCRKNVDLPTTTTTTNITPPFFENYEPPIDNITSSVSGIVVDEMGNILEDVKVTLGNAIVMTNQLGTFRFENTTMNKLGTFIQVEKEGYFLSGRRFHPTEGNSTKVKIELLEKNFATTFESNAGGPVAIQGDGGTIVFSPNSIKTETGEPYSGTVQVASKWLNPKSQSTTDQMPGSLEGVNSSNEEVGLVTYGMVGVELIGSAGEALNIAEGATAQIKMNVPPSLQNSAPTEIPLWSFNYEFGIWVEEGSAQLENGQYVGEVSHFSFWNCDDFVETVEFSVTIIDDNTNPLENILVTIELANAANSGSGYTNGAGIVSGIIPANEALILNIFDNCGDLHSQQNIGPFTSNTNLGNIEMTIPTMIVTGNLVNCNNELVTDGIILVKTGSTYREVTFNNNPFELTIPLCANNSDDIEIIGGDISTFQQGDPIIISPMATANIGSLIACGDALLGYMKFTINGTTTRLYEINKLSYQVPAPSTYYFRMSMFNQPAQSPGDTLGGDMYFFLTDLTPMTTTMGIDILIDSENGLYTTDAVDNCIIEQVGAIGSILKGTMSGTIENNYGGNSVDITVEGAFSAIIVPF